MLFLRLPVPYRKPKNKEIKTNIHWPYVMRGIIIDDPVYGREEITDASVIAIINTPEFQRLKSINQYGVGEHMTPRMPTTRYEHSIGVYLLLRRLGAGFEEQIAGLLHDISHTAFSHVIDFFLGENTTQEFHHNHFEGMLEGSAINQILANEGFSVKGIIGHERFKLLEDEGKGLCADRIDYSLRDGLVFGVLDKKDVGRIVGSFAVKDGRIVMNDKESAKLFAFGYLNTSKGYWTNPLFGGSYEVLCSALRIAFEKGAVSEEDFFLTDNEVISKMRMMNDEKVDHYLDNVDWANLEECGLGDAEFKVLLKVRYVDPLFIDGDRVIPYSDADPAFREDIKEFSEHIKKGFWVRIKPKHLN